MTLLGRPDYALLVSILRTAGARRGVARSPAIA
jgi:hypothetical protein